MAWPDARDFADAVQNARIHFSDNELRGSQPVTNAFGLPQVFSGNFSSVIPMECGTHKWAVKCFTRYSEPLAERYPHIVREIEKRRVHLGWCHATIKKMDFESEAQLTRFSRCHGSTESA